MSRQPPKKPLSRLQAFLKELKACIRLFREVLVEIKDLLAILTVIVFFVFGVYEALSRLISQPPRSEAQIVSRPHDQDRR
jgi:hypothetical protein